MNNRTKKAIQIKVKVKKYKINSK